MILKSLLILLSSLAGATNVFWIHDLARGEVTMPDSETIQFKIEMLNAMWLGLGWGSGMEGGVDMFILSYDDDDGPIVQDYCSYGFYRPTLDKDQQNYDMVEADRNETHAIFVI